MTESKHKQLVTVQILSDSTNTNNRLLTHTCTISHILFSTPFFPQLNHTVQLKQVGPENIPHRTCKTLPQLRELHCGVVWCGLGVTGAGGRRRGRKTDFLAVEQVGMQLLPGWYANEKVKGWGWVGALFGCTFTPREAITKVAKWCHRHTQGGPSLSFPSAEWQQGVRGKWHGQVKRNIFIIDMPSGHIMYRVFSKEDPQVCPILKEYFWEICVFAFCNMKLQDTVS